jgi:hypothetical protein
MSPETIAMLPPPLSRDARSVGNSVWELGALSVVSTNRFEFREPPFLDGSFPALFALAHAAIAGALLKIEVFEWLRSRAGFAGLHL